MLPDSINYHPVLSDPSPQETKRAEEAAEISGWYTSAAYETGLVLPWFTTDVWVIQLNVIVRLTVRQSS